MGNHDDDVVSGPNERARHLGRVLRAMQRESGRSLRSLAAQIHVSHSSLSRYMRGEVLPPWDSVARICDATGGDLERARALWLAAAEARGDEPAEPAEAVAERTETAWSWNEAPDAVADRAAVRGVVARKPAGVTGVWPPTPVHSSGVGRGIRAVPARKPVGLVRLWLPRRLRPAGAVSALAWLAVGLAAGLVLGLELRGTTAVAASPGAQTGITAVVTPGQSGAPRLPDGKFCPWKYIVTDGHPDDLRVFDDPRRDSIIARYVPDEVFYAPDPPQIVGGMMRTEQGWVSMGDWVQRYSGETCHLGSS